MKKNTNKSAALIEATRKALAVEAGLRNDARRAVVRAHEELMTHVHGRTMKAER